HLLDEIIDHSIRFRMSRIEARQFAVCDEVQASQFLSLEDDHHSVTQDQPRCVADEPGWDRITSDDGCLDAINHLYAYGKYGGNSAMLLDRSREKDGQSMCRDRRSCQGFFANLVYQS